MVPCFCIACGAEITHLISVSYDGLDDFGEDSFSIEVPDRCPTCKTWFSNEMQEIYYDRVDNHVFENLKLYKS